MEYKAECFQVLVQVKPEDEAITTCVMLNFVQTAIYKTWRQGLEAVSITLEYDVLWSVPLTAPLEFQT